MEVRSQYAGIVLCGGKSRRMGRSKADLPFGTETLLQRVVRVLSDVVGHIVVVHAAEQSLPDFADNVTTVADTVPFGGPLIGLQTGLEAVGKLNADYAAVYLTSCDAPFLSSHFVREILRLLDGHDIAVPFDEKFFFPLAAGYGTHVLANVQDLVREGERRPRVLFDVCNTRRLDTNELTRVDPSLQSLVNLNTPEDYKSALVTQQLPIPAWLHEH